MVSAPTVRPPDRGLRELFHRDHATDGGTSKRKPQQPAGSAVTPSHASAKVATGDLKPTPEATGPKNQRVYNSAGGRRSNVSSGLRMAQFPPSHACHSRRNPGPAGRLGGAGDSILLCPKLSRPASLLGCPGAAAGPGAGHTALNAQRSAMLACSAAGLLIGRLLHRRLAWGRWRQTQRARNSKRFWAQERWQSSLQQLGRRRARLLSWGCPASPAWRDWLSNGPCPTSKPVQTLGAAEAPITPAEPSPKTQTEPSSETPAEANGLPHQPTEPEPASSPQLITPATVV